MNTTCTLPELAEYLNKLLDCNALELIFRSDKDSAALYIPYMMNDALENYLILENCQITGAFSAMPTHEQANSAVNAKLSAGTGFDILEKTSSEGKHALIFYKENDEVITIWFSSCTQSVCYYQYHRIGHFWRDGQEHLRRLVYIIGTIYEKHAFLGSDACNDQELKLLQLMGFAPFRYWSPIHESLDDANPDTPNGIFFMHQYALEAGDASYARWIRLYRRFPYSWIKYILTKKLLSPNRENLYQLIDLKINQASLPYPVRDYGPKRNTEIEKIRSQFAEKLYADGFTGIYPYFHKNDMQLIAMVEHPFTISELEYENFDFRIRGMITEHGRHSLYEKH